MSDSNEKKVSYGLGWQFGRHLLTHDFDGLDLEAVFSGIRDCYVGNESPYTDEEAEKAFKAITADVEAKRSAEATQAAGQSIEFMRQNAERDDINITPSGLQYEILELGKGSKPGPLDSVHIHYHGMLTNGHVFDSSMERSTPAEFPLQSVIAGWTEGLQLIPVGTKCRFYIPAELAYGELGHPPGIPGNAALIFNVELLDIV